VVDVETGDVELASGVVEPVRVEYAAEWTGNTKPEIAAYVTDGTLHIEGDCPNLGVRCSTTFFVVLPPGVDVDLRTVTGDVDIDGMNHVTAQTTTGDIYLRDLSGELDVRVTTGDIEGVDLRGTWVYARTTTGRIDLEQVGAFDSMDVKTTTGAIGLEVPSGTYDLDLHATTGSVEMHSVVDDPQAAEKITARTTTGGILVAGY